MNAVCDPSHKLAVVFPGPCDTDSTYPSIKSPKLTRLLSGQQDTWEAPEGNPIFTPPLGVDTQTPLQIALANLILYV